MTKYATLISIFFFVNSWTSTAQTGIADTLVVKTGECKPLKLNIEGVDALLWNTGNQDIAVPEAVFGSVKICGAGEGVTYISGSSANSDRQIKIVVKVIPDPTKKIIAKALIPEFQSSVDHDVEEILKKTISGESDRGFKPKLKVSENNRYLVEENTGKPFLFLSQTLWSITRRLSREDVVKALDICKEQGFTAVQLLAHSHYMGPNVYGNAPFENENFLRPVLSVGNSLQVQGEYDWWDHLEFIIQECIKREMYVCLLPTWREQWNQKKNLHKNNAFAYGKFIGQRYWPYNPWIIWVMGGDEAPNTPQKMEIHRELARGVATGVSGKEDYSQVMMTYHTHGPTSTADFFPENEPFMDFNTIQSGHSLKNLEGMIEKTYQTQQKPVMDFEPFYTKNGQNTNEARTTIYWGIFSGGFGTSYGSWNLWHCGDRNDLAPFSIPDGFYEGFGTQIGHLGKLLSSYPMQLREPNQKLLIDNRTSGLDRILACSATDKSYAMVYSPKGEPFTVDLSFLAGKTIHWKWFNPSNGEIHSNDAFRRKSNQHLFTPPTRGERFTGNDWVLIIMTTAYQQKPKEKQVVQARWSEAQAQQWSAENGWLRGSNFNPSTAINQLETWQAESFDTATINRELAWAAAIGMNVMRVYLHHLAWQVDQKGFKSRMNTYLGIAEKHEIKTIFVFFDDCWNPTYAAGKQPDPKPGVHNSGWVRDPGDLLFQDSTLIYVLESYVKDVLTTFKEDKRVIMWDLYNEPGNFGYGNKSMPLLKKVFEWAWEIRPSQPLSVGVCNIKFQEINEFSLENSDIITYHNYNGPEKHQAAIDTLKKYNRPLVCTEYMARRKNSLFTNIMPLLKENNVGAINWGLVDGKSNTKYAYSDSITDGSEPPLWFHDIFRRDGTPYKQEEVDLIKSLTGKSE